ncbi:MAG: DUF1841 family protein [Gammaproteobacteria bacterium]|nr:MAG: DUF1841 family protein [Gammaproteobacteria bacterium]
MFDADRNQMRQMFFQTWRKYQQKLALEPMERLVGDIIVQHPEYHDIIEKPETSLEREYHPEQGETNPFLHMGMHIAIAEQLGSDRPAGFRDMYQALQMHFQDSHTAEHHIMECLGECLWQAQRQGFAPDELKYLDCLRQLLQKTGK